MRPLIILFARAPVAGRVKTRLAREFGDAAALRLHCAFVVDTAARASRRCSIELHTDAPTDAWPELDCPRRLQHQGDLGARLLAALSDALASGCPHAAVIGTDAPDLPAGHLASLFETDADVCLGPAEDGGFWGIACRRVGPAMFAGVEWSTPRALEQTVAACRACGLTVSLAASWPDVDDPADLLRLARSPALDPKGATTELLRALHLRGPDRR